ncbi:MAG: hypothetical protein JZU63_09115, partial [Rhodoferax sp.]|nr:hypothetical protein [Rhodoferax sp.]
METAAMSSFEFPASQTSVSFDVAVGQEIFKRLDKIDAVNADLSAKINHILVRMDEHTDRIANLEKTPEEEEPVPCIPSQGPFFLLRAYYVLWF